MNDWVDFSALGKVVWVGLLAGAGLPAIFAIGLRLLHLGAPADQMDASGTVTLHHEAGSEKLVGGSPLGVALAGLCFAIVLAAIGWGIYLIVAGS